MHDGSEKGFEDQRIQNQKDACYLLLVASCYLGMSCSSLFGCVTLTGPFNNVERRTLNIEPCVPRILEPLNPLIRPPILLGLYLSG